MKVKVTLVKLIIVAVEYQILLLCPANDIEMFIKVKVISRSRSYQGKCHSRSRLPKVKATQDQGHSTSWSFKVISWSRSSQGHSHFEVKVILESNGNVF